MAARDVHVVGGVPFPLNFRCGYDGCNACNACNGSGAGDGAPGGNALPLQRVCGHMFAVASAAGHLSLWAKGPEGASAVGKRVWGGQVRWGCGWVTQ